MTGGSEPASQLRLTWHGTTVVGKVRTNNEDTLWGAAATDVGAQPGDTQGVQYTDWAGLLLAVADGMGGALAGEVASRLAVTTLGEEFRQRVEAGTVQADSPEACGGALVGSVERANQIIRAEGEGNPQYRGMGTTLTAVWLHGQTADIAQVGDSRAYLFRGGHLRQLTKDQSLVGKLIEDGIITEEEAERIAGRNIILQALGSEEELDVVWQAEQVESGDLLLLCTDGLSGVMNNPDIEAMLRRGGTPEELCDRLTAEAEERGGPDNITVLIGRVDAA